MLLIPCMRLDEAGEVDRQRWRESRRKGNGEENKTIRFGNNRNMKNSRRRDM